MPETVFTSDIDENRLAEAVAKVIKRYRKKAGISRDQLAFHLTLHKNTLYGVEVGVKRKSGTFGHTQLTLPNFVRIAKFFNVAPGEFLEEVLSEAIEDEPSISSQPSECPTTEENNP